MELENFAIFSGRGSDQFAKKVCESLDQDLGVIEWKVFADGERCPAFEENVRGHHIFLVQSTNQPDDNFMDLLLMIDAAKRASAKEITAVIPYFGWGRQDRKLKPRVPISAKLIADLIQTAGASRILTMDLHCGQIQGFFNIPVDHLFARPVFIDHAPLRDNLVVLSPDGGAVAMCRSYAKRLNDCPVAVADKRRPEPNKSEIIHILGDVKDKAILIIDEMVDTAGTLTEAAKAAKDHDAWDVYACCTHPVLSSPSLQRIENSSIDVLYVTDTIPIFQTITDKIQVVSVAPLFAEAIKRIYKGNSLSELFE